MTEVRPCFLEPIPEIYDAARYLDAAVSAHLNGNAELAKALIVQADTPTLAEWNAQFLLSTKEQPFWKLKPNPVSQVKKVKNRMPGTQLKRDVIQRDGYHCRFCDIPVVRAEVRKNLHKLYPKKARWGPKNKDQHAGLVAMWLQYDHVCPHSMGGTNTLDNLVITCAPCNYGKMGYTVEELYLEDPRDRPIIQSTWDGLERLLG